MGLDAKIYWLTDRQLQCDFDFDFLIRRESWKGSEKNVSLVWDGRLPGSYSVAGMNDLWGQSGREQGRGGSYGVESRYQATTGEDTAYWEDFIHAVVNCRLC
jgi:hypothetical protein